MFSPSRGTSFASFPFSRSLLIICSVHFLLLTPESQFPSPHTQSCQSFSNALLVVMPEFASNLFTIFQVFETHQNEVLLPRKSHGWRSLVSCSPWGRQESDTTEWLHFHFSLSCIGEWNGNTLQCSCLENPRDGGAWWAAVYGVAQSQTRLKRLSSSSSSRMKQSVSSALTKCRHRSYPQEILAVLHTCSSAMHFYGGAALILTGDFPLYDICSRNFLLGYNLTFQRCILLKVSVPSHCYI